MIDLILLMAGQSTRFNDEEPKQFFKINSQELFEISLKNFLNFPEISRVFLVVAKKYTKHVENIIKGYPQKDKIFIVPGGLTRQESSYNALKAIYATSKHEHVIIHDACRPLISKKIISKIIENLLKNKQFTLYLPNYDSLALTDGAHFLQKYVNRAKIVHIQTPQSFNFDIIFKAHQEAINLKISNATDDAQLLLLINQEVELLEGDIKNLKVTTKDDLLLVDYYLKNYEF